MKHFSLVKIGNKMLNKFLYKNVNKILLVHAELICKLTYYFRSKICHAWSEINYFKNFKTLWSSSCWNQLWTNFSIRSCIKICEWNQYSYKRKKFMISIKIYIVIVLVIQNILIKICICVSYCNILVYCCNIYYIRPMAIWCTAFPKQFVTLSYMGLRIWSYT